MLNVYRQVIEALRVEEEQIDVNAIKSENKEIRHQIFDLHEQLRVLQE